MHKGTKRPSGFLRIVEINRYMILSKFDFKISIKERKSAFVNRCGEVLLSSLMIRSLDGIRYGKIYLEEITKHQ